MWWVPCVIVPAWLVAGIFAYAIKKYTCKIHYGRYRPRGHTSEDERHCWYYGLFGLLGLISILDYNRHNFEKIGLCWKMPQALLASQENKRR